MFKPVLRVSKSRELYLLVAFGILLFLVVSLYIFGWRQSNFKCWSWDRPIRFLFNSSEQLYACRYFSDLGFGVEVTKEQVNEVIEERKASSANLSVEEAANTVLGQAKIEEYAKRNNITVSDEEINNELEKVYKEYGGKEKFLGAVPQGDNKVQIRGSLLQKKVEAKVVDYASADFVALRWDVFKSEIWQPKIEELREEAKKDLVIIGEALKNNLGPKEAAKAASVDQGKFGFNLGESFKLYRDPGNPQPYLKALDLPLGVSDPICDDRFCVVFRILEANDGSYSSLEDFLGGLTGW